MTDLPNECNAYTLTYRDILPACRCLYIQIKTPKNIEVRILNRLVIAQGEQLGIRFLKEPQFLPGNRRIIPVCLDDRSDAQAATCFFSDPTDVNGGTLIEESMVPKFAYHLGGTPVEAPIYARTLQENSNYMLVVRNEGFAPTDVLVCLLFTETPAGNRQVT